MSSMMAPERAEAGVQHRRVRTAMTTFGHPVLAGAVLVLAVNDQVLKERYATWWTGKLSDFAGVFVVAVLLGVLTRRPRLAAAATGVGFAMLKLVPAVAVAAAPVLGGVTLRDPTDLVALVMVWPAVSFTERGRPAGSTPRVGGARGRRGESWWETARGVLGQMVSLAVLAATVLTVTATSCAGSPFVDGLVATEDGTVLARVSTRTGDRDYGPWAVSDDGGATWADTSEEPESGTEELDAARTEACSAELGCFRIGERADRVEHRPDGTGEWSRSFSYPPGDWDRMIDGAECAGEQDALFSALVVVDGPGGEHVVVAMGQYGVVHRTPAGDWEEEAVFDMEPVDASTGDGGILGVPWVIVAVAVGAFVVAVLAVAVPLLIGRRKRRRAPLPPPDNWPLAGQPPGPGYPPPQPWPPPAAPGPAARGPAAPGPMTPGPTEAPESGPSSGGEGPPPSELPPPD